jgi:Icc-related predicted phosphoesterase/predicted protein tyrosine phosphatase
MIRTLVAVADLHGRLPERIPTCDLLLLAGDLCPNGIGQFEWLDRDFRKWLKRVSARHVVATWGNHDFIGQSDDVPALPCTFLVDETVEIEGVRVHGTPWMPGTGWAFTEDEDVLAGCFARIPDRVDILVSHVPPYGWLDLDRYGQHIGSRALLAAVERARPGLTICGHAHLARGAKQAPWGRIVNASAVDDRLVAYTPPYVRMKWERTPDIVVMSVDEAEAYEPTGIEVCISITDPNASLVRLSPRFADVLRISFTDIARPTSFPFDVLFDAKHARKILKFLDRWAHAQRVVVHCVAGVSRSPGVALAVCDLRGLDAKALEERYPSWNTWVRSELVRVGRAKRQRIARAERHS